MPLESARGGCLSKAQSLVPTLTAPLESAGGGCLSKAQSLVPTLTAPLESARGGCLSKAQSLVPRLTAPLACSLSCLERRLALESRVDSRTRQGRTRSESFQGLALESRVDSRTRQGRTRSESGRLKDREDLATLAPPPFPSLCPPPTSLLESTHGRRIYSRQDREDLPPSLSRLIDSTWSQACL